MADQTGVTVRVVFNRIPAYTAALHAGAVAEVERSAREIEAAAKGRVHVITGTLQRSIHTVIAGGGLTATVGPSVAYGIYEEFGSRGRGPHPFMRPAAELVLPRFTDRMATLVKGGGI